MRSLPRSLAILVAVMISSTACVRTTATRLGAGSIRPPVPEHLVAIYRTADQVPGKYEEVALLNSTGNYSSTDEEKMFKSMREKAGQVGANGVILDSIKEPGTGGKVAQALFGVGGDRKGKAIAIFVLPTATQSDGAAQQGAPAKTPQR